MEGMFQDRQRCKPNFSPNHTLLPPSTPQEVNKNFKTEAMIPAEAVIFDLLKALLKSTTFMDIGLTLLKENEKL